MSFWSLDIIYKYNIKVEVKQRRDCRVKKVMMINKEKRETRRQRWSNEAFDGDMKIMFV